MNTKIIRIINKEYTKNELLAVNIAKRLVELLTESKDYSQGQFQKEKIIKAAAKIIRNFHEEYPENKEIAYKLTQIISDIK